MLLLNEINDERNISGIFFLVLFMGARVRPRVGVEDSLESDPVITRLHVEVRGRGTGQVTVHAEQRPEIRGRVLRVWGSRAQIRI